MKNIIFDQRCAECGLSDFLVFDQIWLNKTMGGDFKRSPPLIFYYL